MRIIDGNIMSFKKRKSIKKLQLVLNKKGQIFFTNCIKGKNSKSLTTVFFNK